jgi:hypothetical protein
MTEEDLPTFPLASFAKRGVEYTAAAQRLAPNGGEFAACFSIRGKCTHGFRVIIRGVPRLFLLRRSARDGSWLFAQVEGGDRTIRVTDN